MRVGGEEVCEEGDACEERDEFAEFGVGFCELLRSSRVKILSKRYQMCEDGTHYSALHNATTYSSHPTHSKTALSHPNWSSHTQSPY